MKIISVKHFIFCVGVLLMSNSLLAGEPDSLTQNKILQDFENCLAESDYTNYSNTRDAFKVSIDSDQEFQENIWNAALIAARHFRDFGFTKYIYDMQMNEHSTICDKNCKHQSHHNHNHHQHNHN